MCDISLLFLIWTGRWLWGVGGNICTPKTHQMWNTQETRNTTVHAKMAGTLWGSGLTEWRIRWEMKQGKSRALHSIFSFTMSCPIQFRKEKKKTLPRYASADKSLFSFSLCLPHSGSVFVLFWWCPLYWLPWICSDALETAKAGFTAVQLITNEDNLYLLWNCITEIWLQDIGS